MFKQAKTASQYHEVEKKYGVRYSVLLKLPYFDIVEYHVIDPMHNLLLGTGKYLMTLWKEQQILSKSEFEDIQAFVNSIKVPPNVGRIPIPISVDSRLTSGRTGYVCILYYVLKIH